MSRFASLLAFPFRPFFLLTGIYGAITALAWVSYLFGGIPLPVGWSPVHWHAHEMLFGLTTAAIAGFLLTAMCNWTGAAPLRGIGLLGLAALWIAGRAMMWTADWWPLWFVALMDFLFLPVMAIYVSSVLLRYGNKRNLILAGILIILAAANAMMHWGFITNNIIWLMSGELLAINVITLMMVIIGGRIIPLFTLNWLRNNGHKPDDVKSHTAIDRTALIATALMLPADFITNTHWLTGSIAGIAAAAHLLRLIGWSGWKASREPLLWILHVGYGWIIFALFLKCAAAFGLIAPTAWLHALGAGAMGALILGIMTRVALGHTGRTLKLPRFAVTIYLMITFAAIVRVATALQFVNYHWGLIIAAACWSLAFMLFVFIYWPILSCPRIDGKPG